jgi:uncharacterized membrane protein (DUF373 family)
MAVNRERKVLERAESGTQPESGLWTWVADRIYPALVRLLTVTLIVVLCVWIGAGAVNILLAVGKITNTAWTDAAQRTIVDSLIMLALLEVVRALQSYLKLGRVRVTFIIDAALVVLIGELIGLWFKEYAADKVLLGMGVIVTLVALRIVTARYSPEPHSTI